MLRFDPLWRKQSITLGLLKRSKASAQLNNAMPNASDTVFRLTEGNLSAADRLRSLRDFAEATGWFPSDEIVEDRACRDFASGHLLVEHGMANTAVISFLKSEHSVSNLSNRAKLHLLEISYNNLVDWHLLPDKDGITALYNRTEPAREFRFSGREYWRAEAFRTITAQSVRPEVKALDEAFISTISYWKRAIGGELDFKVSNEVLSGLFNTLIFIRALEDHKRNISNNSERLLVELFVHDSNLTVEKCCQAAIRKLGRRTFPAFIKDQSEHLSVFDSLQPETTRELMLNLYKNRFTPYEYDFSLITKHALSRIYEHYVSVLRSTEDAQMQFFPGLADEVTNRELGSYYTPQYIARFFARYLQENKTPREFRELKAIDPACGSGIFLRTLLELQCDPMNSMSSKDSRKQAFRNVTGLDVDVNACEATRLSLSLLHLVLTDEFPRSLDIQNYDAVEYAIEQRKLEKYDAVIANPPYISWDAQPEEWRIRVREYLGGLFKGKVDIYIAILKVGLDLIKPGGYGCFVIPHTFLYANSSRKLRDHIVEHFWISFVADLSDLKVFDDVNSYTILLIVPKKQDLALTRRATVVKCRSSVGYALNTALHGRTADNEFFRVFETSQESFADSTWQLLPPAQENFIRRLEELPTLGQMADVQQGVVTGADDVFLQSTESVPKRERTIWRPLLSDRDMVPFSVPNQVNRLVFHPFVGEEKITQALLKKDYPKTWAHIRSHEQALKSRKAVINSGNIWWQPIRSRDPKTLYSQKIVCPHLMLTPRFALDKSGQFAVTRSPFITPNASTEKLGIDFLYYLLAVLNSTVGFWQIAAQSHKYDRQYSMVEVKTLKSFRLPDPQKVPKKKMEKLIDLVKIRMNGYDPETERTIDELVVKLYGLSESDLTLIGIA